jgi:hypothetical protein
MNEQKSAHIYNALDEFFKSELEFPFQFSVYTLLMIQLMESSIREVTCLHQRIENGH